MVPSEEQIDEAFEETTSSATFTQALERLQPRAPEIDIRRPKEVEIPGLERCPHFPLRIKMVLRSA